MKKKIFVFLACLMGCVALSYAGNPVKLVKGDKEVFFTEATVNVVIDDHKTLIDRKDQTADVYYGAQSADEYAKFTDDLDRAHKSFITYFNEKKRKALVTMADSSATAAYTLRIKVEVMNVGNAGGMIWGMSRKAGGAQIEGTMQLVDNAADKVVCEFKFSEVKGLMAPVFRARAISVYRYLADGLLKAVEK